MKPTQRLDIRQGQQLAMTPQLQQSLKILQYTSAELASYLAEELEQNPLLTLAEHEAEEIHADSPAPENEGGGDDTASEVDMERPLESSNDERDNAQDDVVQAWEGESQGLRKLSASGEDNDDMEQGLTRPITLREHLEQQILLDFGDTAERLIALQLLDHLDDSGYLSAEYTNVATQLGCTVEQLDKVIDKLQRLDPPGIFARGLAECLRLQLRERNRLDPAIDALLNHLDWLAAAEWNKLSRVCGVGEEDIREMVQEIRQLNPKPGQKFERSGAAESWQPDVFVRRSPDGWKVELNPETMPRVLFHRNYYAEVTKKAKDKAEKKYLSEYAQSANWLVRSLEQRANTVLQVASEIVAQQHAFLELGVYHLRPMILKDIAEKIGVHESTVGRVVNGKYMATPKGVFEFRYFFSSGITSLALISTEGDEVSSHAVRQAIQDLIEAEEETNVLSDEALTTVLKSKGYEVARRTVAKYREGLGIPSSSERRRSKKLAAAMKT